jgi:hypothetical protein
VVGQRVSREPRADATGAAPAPESAGAPGADATAAPEARAAS